MTCSLPSSTPADAAAPTILTSHPEGKHSAYVKDGANYKGPHGCCQKCKYEVFVRREDRHHCRPDGPTLEGRRRSAASAEADTSLPADDPARSGKRRTAISAEAFGIFGQEHQQRLQAIPKCKDVRRFLWNALISAGTPLKEWARDLEEDFFEQVISAARAWRAEAGDEIILQGEPLADTAPGIFILESGQLDVYKAYTGDALPGELVKTYDRKGDYFGELGVLYGAPRAATVVAAGTCHLWSIDRNAMTTLKRQCMEARRLRYSRVLASAELLAALGPEDRMQVIDNLRPVLFKDGEAIIQQGDEGDEFFILERGNAVVEKDGEEVARYGPGSCFGELALLNSEPRAASVIAASSCICAVLDRASFDRLLGPLATIRARAKALSPPSRSSRGHRVEAQQEHPGSTPNAKLKSARRSTGGNAVKSACEEPQEELIARTPNAEPRPSCRSSSSCARAGVHGELQEELPARTPSAEPRLSRRSNSGRALWSIHGEPEEEQRVQTSYEEPRLSRRSSGGHASGSVHGEPQEDRHQEEQRVQAPCEEHRLSRRSDGGRASGSTRGEPQEEQTRATRSTQSRCSRYPIVSMSIESDEGIEMVEEPRQVCSHEPRSSRQVTSPVKTRGDHDLAQRKSLPMTLETRGRTPPPPDYAMSREDRLMYDSEEDDLPMEGGGSELSATPARAHSRPRLSEAASLPVTPEQRDPPSTPTRSRLSAGAAVMKNLLRMGRKSSSREEAASPLQDAAAPCAL